MKRESNSIIDLENVSFSYRHCEDQVLKRLNLQIRPGELLAVAGPTGAGKSTFCLTLNGLIPHFIAGKMTGKVTVDGRETAKYEPKDLSPVIGIVFQNFETQLFTTSVELEVAFGPENLCLDAAEIRERVKKYLEFTGLAGLEKKEPSSLSGGEKQRLAIAAIMAVEPKIICLDEPTTDLDPLGKSEVLAVTRKIQKEMGTTLILVEHETEELLAADQLLLMQDGQVKALGAPADILRDIGLLRESGIRPLAVTELFSDGTPRQNPLTIDEAEKIFRERGGAIDREKYGRLLSAEKKRAAKYGDKQIEFKQVSFNYGNQQALRNIDLQVRQGEFVAVLGQNGSGKTTLIKQLNGLLTPSQGEVSIKDRDTRNESVRTLSKTVGYVFQNPDHQIIMETVFDDVAFGPRFAKLSEKEIKQRVDEALAAVKLTGWEKCDPVTLAKGQRQKVAVAAVLANKPEILVLDEPTTGLDERELRGMMQLIESLNEAGHTIIIVTHNMWVAAEYAHRIIVLKNGEVFMDGPAREVFAQPDKLRASHLQPPQITRFSQQIGCTFLSVPECKDCLIFKKKEV